MISQSVLRRRSYGFKDEASWKIGVNCLSTALTTEQRTAIITSVLLTTRRRHPHLRTSDLQLIGQLAKAATKMTRLTRNPDR